MIFNIFVENLNERNLHMAADTALHNNYRVRKLGSRHQKSMLRVACDDFRFVKSVVDILEKKSDTQVLAITDGRGNRISFRHPPHKLTLVSFANAPFAHCS